MGVRGGAAMRVYFAMFLFMPFQLAGQGVFAAEAVSQLAGGLACFTTMYFTVYRPLGRLEDGGDTF